MDKKYLHSFKDRNEYDKYIQTGYTRPFASATYVGKGDPENEIMGHRIDFNLKDSEKYDLERKTNLTFKITCPGTLYWVGLNTSAETEALSYRKNFGEWFTVQRGIVTNCSEGDIIEFKASMSDNHMVFSGDSNLSYTVYGNVMSLQYPESFEEQSAMTGTFYKLFSNCTGLYSDDMRELVLPAMVLVDGAYESMFEGCTSLVVAPKLPAKSLSVACYKSMFKDCESLSKAPQLPSNQIPDSAYHSMFMNCTSLVTAPDMISDNKVRFTTDNEDLRGRNLRQMFKGCTSLVNGPSEIPTVYMPSENGYYVYEEMFMGCSRLMTAPDIMNKSNFIYSADREVFKHMFKDCTSLNYIHAEFEGVYYTGSTLGWVNNVASAGTFVKSVNSHWKVVGDNGVPLNWVIENEPKDYREEYLTFNILSSGTIYWKADNVNNTKAISYSLNNGQSWTEIYSTTEGVAIVVSKDARIMFKGNNAMYSDNTGRANTFSGSTAIFEVEGNILSLINSTNFTGITGLASAYTFEKLFVGCTGLTTAENLILEAEELSKSCYASLFRGCTSLVTPPMLLSETLAELCYFDMFLGCTSLAEVPELPATILATNCYGGMFQGCTSLTEAPVLNATALTNGCYSGMFQYCTGIISAPILPALTLSESCYASMFKGCSSLNYIKCLATDISADNCTNNWVNNVANSGTFIKNDDMDEWLIDNVNGIPIGWTLVSENQIVPLTFEITSGGVINWKATSNDTVKTIWYSTNNGLSWTQYTSSLEGNSFEVEVGDVVLFRGDNDCYGKLNSDTDFSTFSGTTAKFNVRGNIMSLLDSTWYSASTTLVSGSTFLKLFGGCTTLVDASKLQLPATTLKPYCYRNMFIGCHSLTGAPKLNAMIMDDFCYAGMFHDCRSLVVAPKLPSTNLGNYCYDAMFALCSNLTVAPELPATVISAYSYSEMFHLCTSLVNAPDLPGTTLSNQCYRGMFYGCSSLTHPSVMSAATSIAYWACVGMYEKCTSLVTPPELPATTLGPWAYDGMFRGCTSLATAPVLPASALSDHCYAEMFNGCTALTDGPGLSATTLATGCYMAMFSACTSLSGAPVLPASTLVSECYREMFYGCSNLDYIMCLATDIFAENCTTNWVSGVAATGTFVKHLEMDDWEIDSPHGVPEGWTLENDAIDYSKRYLTFEIISGGTIKWKSTDSSNTGKTIQYSTDGGNSWNNLTSNSNPASINVSAGDEVLFKGNNSSYGVTSKTAANTFAPSTAKFKISGNIMSLLNSTGFTTMSATNSVATFAYLFDSCSGLCDATNLVLPAKTLSSYCYRNMLSSCLNLERGPELPAINLADNCYRGMFSKSKMTIPQSILPATFLPYNCYNYMYEGCSFEKAPVLPDATFSGNNCCNYMFLSCHTLNYIKCFWSNPSTGASSCWTYYVADSGTFVYNKDIDISAWEINSVNGIPHGWTPIIEQDPEYLSFTIVEDGVLKWKTNNAASAMTIYYSRDDGDTWKRLKATTAGTPITVSAGDIILFKGDNETYADSSFNYNSFEGSTAGFILGGNILSLIDSEYFDSMTEITSPYAFYRLFADCTGLTLASNLKLTAQTLSNYCYHEMFEGCTSLTAAPILPAESLSNYCYYAMFDGCTSLTTSPELGAETLVEGCYKDMFKNCSSLNVIRCYATSISATDCTSNWVYNVSGSGTFVRSDLMSGWTINSVNGIPIGWTVFTESEYEDYLDTMKPLTFDIISAGTIYWKTTKSSFTRVIEYTKDEGETWTSITASTTGVSIPVEDGDRVMFRGNNVYYCLYSSDSIANFSGSTAKFNLKGNIMSLIDSTGYTTATTLSNEYNFYALFYRCEGLISAEKLFLPATTLSKGCYASLFNSCSGLITPPELPAMNTVNSCYRSMFAGCTSLTTAPELPATALTDTCYESMFINCASLVNVPELPATTLVSRCYWYMFKGCTSLQTAPVLPAQTLTTNCYQYMFSGCSSLNYIECYATNISAYECTVEWVAGVSGSGTFVKADSMSGWSTGISGIPNGWTIEDAT